METLSLYLEILASLWEQRADLEWRLLTGYTLKGKNTLRGTANGSEMGPGSLFLTERHRAVTGPASLQTLPMGIASAFGAGPGCHGPTTWPLHLPSLQLRRPSADTWPKSLTVTPDTENEMVSCEEWSWKVMMSKELERSWGPQETSHEDAESTR